MTQSLSEQERFDRIRIGVDEDLGTVVLTQAQIDENRRALDWPEAPFPVLHAPNGDSIRESFPTRVNGRSIRRFFNPPLPGRKIRLRMRIVEKYVRNGAPYVVEETTATDEDGQLIEVMTVHQLLRTRKVGEKWA